MEMEMECVFSVLGLDLDLVIPPNGVVEGRGECEPCQVWNHNEARRSVNFVERCRAGKDASVERKHLNHRLKRKIG